MSTFYESFGRLLQASRDRRGLTQSVLAKRVGLSRTSIANIETGRQRVPLHMLQVFASALGLEPAALLPPLGAEDVREAVEGAGRGPDIASWAEQALARFRLEQKGEHTDVNRGGEKS